MRRPLLRRRGATGSSFRLNLELRAKGRTDLLIDSQACRLRNLDRGEQCIGHRALESASIGATGDQQLNCISVGDRRRGLALKDLMLESAAHDHVRVGVGALANEGVVSDRLQPEGRAAIVTMCRVNRRQPAKCEGDSATSRLSGEALWEGQSERVSLSVNESASAKDGNPVVVAEEGILRRGRSIAHQAPGRHSGAISAELLLGLVDERACRTPTRGVGERRLYQDGVEVRTGESLDAEGTLLVERLEELPRPMGCEGSGNTCAGGVGERTEVAGSRAHCRVAHPWSAPCHRNAEGAGLAPIEGGLGDECLATTREEDVGLDRAPIARAKGTDRIGEVGAVNWLEPSIVGNGLREIGVSTTYGDRVDRLGRTKQPAHRRLALQLAKQLVGDLLDVVKVALGGKLDRVEVVASGEDEKDAVAIGKPVEKTGERADELVELNRGVADCDNDHSYFRGSRLVLEETGDSTLDQINGESVAR